MHKTRKNKANTLCVNYHIFDTPAQSTDRDSMINKFFFRINKRNVLGYQISLSKTTVSTHTEKPPKAFKENQHAKPCLSP